MSYTYLLEQGGVSSAECFSDIPQSVLSKLNLTVEKSYSKDSETESCQSSQFGMMSKPLTENPGKEMLTLSAVDFHVKTFPLPVKEGVSVAKGPGYGESSPGSFAKYNRNTASWKIPQRWLFVDLELSLETWPRWGTMQLGECWELLTPEPRTNEIESGLWPTICKREIDNTGSRILEGTSEIAKDGRRWGASLTTVIKSKTIYKVGKLNPVIGELWMAWPIKWTDLQPLAMDKFQQWLQWHGESWADQPDNK